MLGKMMFSNWETGQWFQENYPNCPTIVLSKNKLNKLNVLYLENEAR